MMRFPLVLLLLVLVSPALAFDASLIAAAQQQANNVAAGGTPPTLVASGQVADWFTDARPRNIGAALSLQSGDNVIICAFNETAGGTTMSLTENGAATITTVYEDQAVASKTGILVGSYTASTTESVTFSITRTAGGSNFGAALYHWRGGALAGTPGTGDGSSTAPSVNVTTGAANSAIVACYGDWNASTATDTWSSTPGTPTTLTDVGDNSSYGVGIASYADVGSAGTKTIALTSPTDLNWRMWAGEIRLN